MLAQTYGTGCGQTTACGRIHVENIGHINFTHACRIRCFPIMKPQSRTHGMERMCYHYGMAHTYAFVDVETTGFDADRDRMTEIAAVIYRDGEIVERYSTLLNPERPIPAVVTEVTNITDAMVATAPKLVEVRSDFKKVLADHIIVGHNIRFDMRFLHANRLGMNNRTLDTVTLSSIIMPQLGRYKLEYLVEVLNLPQTVAHRAEDDAVHSLNLFKVLEERAMDIDMVLLTEIVQVGRAVQWTETLFFEEILERKSRTNFTEGRPKSGIRMDRLFRVPEPEGNPLVPIPLEGDEGFDEYDDEDEFDYEELDDGTVFKIPKSNKGRDKREITPVDVKIVGDLLRPGSNFSNQFPHFEPRLQQIEMVERIAEALNSQQHSIIEAGTGTGKSMAYLIPATFWAVQNDRRVVISTNTINLQDQLINKDIPILQEALPLKFKVAVRKGKSNYLCMRLFRQLRHRGPEDEDEMTLYARILLWLPYSETGDVSELALRTPGERRVWRKLSGENAPCTRNECSQEASCPLHIARRRAEIAHLVIVNHALLLSDVANNHHILPTFHELVIDEAHHLEEAVTRGLSFKADERAMEALFDELKKKEGGILGGVRLAIKQLPQDEQDNLASKITSLQVEAMDALEHLDEFFSNVLYFTRDYIKQDTEWSQSVRLTPDVILRPGWDNVKVTWDVLRSPMTRIIKGLSKLAESIADVNSDRKLEDGDGLRADLQRHYRTMKEVRDALDLIVYGVAQEKEKEESALANPHENRETDAESPFIEMIKWVEVWRNRPSLNAAPLHVAPLVERYLFGELDTVILTSATLRTAPHGRYSQANFDYLRARLGAKPKEVEELALGSPFDYKKNTLLYLCTDIPEPKEPGYQRHVEQAVIDVAKALDGRTLVLFTSYSQLKKTAEAIKPTLNKAGISVLTQVSGSSRQKLTEQFQAPDARAVLLGTRSFWEGVDVPGEALSAVIIVKIPFDVPSDPIIGARSETFDNAFYDYTIPESVLRFRQGFGRLIRRNTDEGIVVVLDKRVLTKRYGELFLNALPETTLLRQKIGRLTEIIDRWESRAR